MPSTRTMKVAEVPRAGADSEIAQREIPAPGPGQVRIKVQACGLCLSDHFVKDGQRRFLILATAV
jgi:D-arabinose 1-dehydrogenase-like Zn-dependent alcohol dehydrogenase